jgi:hypothetical protein
MSPDQLAQLIEMAKMALEAQKAWE